MIEKKKLNILQSEYFIKAILLENCNFSDYTIELLKNIPHKIIYIDDQNNKYRFKYNSIDTFPQIYLNRYNTKGNLLLGGYNDLKQFIFNFKNDINDTKINNFMKKYNWSRKATLRLIELINLK